MAETDGRRRIRTEEERTKISAARKGKGLGHPFYGTPDSIRKMKETKAANFRVKREAREALYSTFLCDNPDCENTWRAAEKTKKYCSKRCINKGKGPRYSLEERFWAKVEKLGPDDCWLWTGSLTTSGGYGQIQRGGRDKGPARAHVISYEMHIGLVPEDLCVLHTCDVTACVNPSHLFLGTREENCKDMGRKKRWANQFAVGENHEPYNQHLETRYGED